MRITVCKKCGKFCVPDGTINIECNGEKYRICFPCFYGKNAYKCAYCKTEFSTAHPAPHYDGKFCPNCKALFYQGKWYKAKKRQ